MISHGFYFIPLSPQNNLECLVTKIMTEARDLLKCERCSVFLLDSDCCEAVSRYTHRSSELFMRKSVCANFPAVQPSFHRKVENSLANSSRSFRGKSSRKIPPAGVFRRVYRYIFADITHRTVSHFGDKHTLSAARDTLSNPPYDGIYRRYYL